MVLLSGGVLLFQTALSFGTVLLFCTTLLLGTVLVFGPQEYSVVCVAGAHRRDVDPGLCPAHQ